MGSASSGKGLQKLPLLRKLSPVALQTGEGSKRERRRGQGDPTSSLPACPSEQVLNGALGPTPRRDQGKGWGEHAALSPPAGGEGTGVPAPLVGPHSPVETHRRAEPRGGGTVRQRVQAADPAGGPHSSHWSRGLAKLVHTRARAPLPTCFRGGRVSADRAMGPVTFS